MAINLSSAFHATRLALPAMQKTNWGRIINVASDPRPGGLGRKIRLRGRQTCCGGPDQGHRAGKRHQRRHLQRHLPRLGADAIGAKTGGRQGRGHGPVQRRSQEAAAERKGAIACNSPRPKSWARWRCFSAHPQATTCAAWPGTWTAAGRPSKDARPIP